jgi:DNA-binding CsgD family transcriptional regulator
MRFPPTDRPRGREVANTCLVNLLDLAGRHGIARGTLLDGLALDGFDARAPFGRMAWDEYAVVFDRLEVALGGPAAMEAFAHEVLHSSRAFRAIAAQLLDLESLTRFGVERLGPALFNHIGTRVDTSPDRTLRVEFALPRGFRGSVAWMRASAASIEAYATLLGIRGVRMTADIHSHGAVVRCALPPSRTLQARAADALKARLDALVFGGTDDASAPTPLTHDLPDDVTAIALAETANEAGQRLAGLCDLDALARALDAHLRERFVASSVRLLVRRSPDAPLEPALAGAIDGAPEPRGTLVRPLYVVGRDVGRLEVDLDPASKPRELDLLLPFVALGVERCLAAAAAGGESARREPKAGAADPWSLTGRERAVLDLVLRGLANKEVAATLGCGVKNVESALSRLFRKVGVGNRTALVGEVLRVGRGART